MARGVSSSFFRRASCSTELRVISPFFSISCKMPVTVERRIQIADDPPLHPGGMVVHPVKGSLVHRALDQMGQGADLEADVFPIFHNGSRSRTVRIRTVYAFSGGLSMAK